jgi:single-stranded-DNA-specific exonuclease
VADSPVALPDADPNSVAPAGATPAVGRLPLQRWCQPAANPQLAQQLASITGLSPLLTQVLVNRGITTTEQATDFLDPERQQLPSPLEEFPDLAASLELLLEAIATQQAIAICGDYDADGMTSTALLLRALRALGGQVSYTIPSRMAEGYGINTRIVEDCHADGVSLILTVDNGIAAVAPIARARELGLAVIVTDHHDIPPEIPPANAILNPKLLPETSPYWGVAGVGVAYILAVCLAQALGRTQDLTGPLLELFTLGTIADLAPLTGVNRRWVRRGLGLLPRSRLFGIQALIQVAGLADQSKPLKPEHIGFRLGPRINAVGRISDPQIVIDYAHQRRCRRGPGAGDAVRADQRHPPGALPDHRATEAIAWCEQQRSLGTVDLERDRVLVVVQPDWHHGVIGIVASRLVERYGVPVFIGTYENDDHSVIRGSARGIPEFDVFAALQTCHDLMEKFGGHRAAGGFSFWAKHLRPITSRLSHYACQTLTVDLLKPLVKIDTQARLDQIDQGLFDQIDHLHPCGIENPDPVFWTPNLRVLEQQTVGRNRDHLKLVLGDEGNTTIKAIAWRWGEYYPLPNRLDVAYKLKQNEWQGNRTVELELVGVRPPGNGTPGSPPRPQAAPSQAQPTAAPPPQPAPADLPVRPRLAAPALAADPSPSTPAPALPDLPSPEAMAPSPSPPGPGAPPDHQPPAAAGATVAAQPAPDQGADFHYSKRRYWAASDNQNGSRQLTIGNPEGQLLVVRLSERQGFLCLPGAEPRPVDVSEAHYFNLIRAGLSAVELQQMTRLLLEKDELLADKDSQIQTLSRQVALLEQQLSQVPQPERQQFKQLQKTLQQQESAIQTQEAHIATMQAAIPTAAPKINTKQVRQQARQAVGDQTWFCLSPDSQKDLYATFKQLALLQAQENRADYSAAATPLFNAIDREILQPLVQGFADYGQTMDDADLLSLATTLQQQPSLGHLPPLLSESWQELTPKALAAASKPRKLLHSVSADQDGDIDDTHRVLLDEFLQGWDHPMAPWLTQANGDAAACLGQVYQLQELTAADTPLGRWQYQLLQQLVLGKRPDPGLFQKIFGGGA